MDASQSVNNRKAPEEHADDQSTTLALAVTSPSISVPPSPKKPMLQSTTMQRQVSEALLGDIDAIRRRKEKRLSQAMLAFPVLSPVVSDVTVPLEIVPSRNVMPRDAGENNYLVLNGGNQYDTKGTHDETSEDMTLPAELTDDAMLELEAPVDTSLLQTEDGAAEPLPPAPIKRQPSIVRQKNNQVAPESNPEAAAEPVVVEVAVSKKAAPRYGAASKNSNMEAEKTAEPLSVVKRPARKVMTLNTDAEVETPKLTVRAMPAAVASVEEASSQKCTFLGNCTCPDCRP